MLHSPSRRRRVSLICNTRLAETIREEGSASRGTSSSNQFLRDEQGEVTRWRMENERNNGDGGGEQGGDDSPMRFGIMYFRWIPSLGRLF